jgi:hypothetical protein
MMAFATPIIMTPRIFTIEPGYGTLSNVAVTGIRPLPPSFAITSSGTSTR